MNLESLKEMKPTRVSHGRPSSSLTDKEWQSQFALMKMHVIPYQKTITRMGGRYSKESGFQYENYDGVTNWQSYCSYINDILRNIRKGHCEYTYYAYQIVDLLKFHYEDLRTRYCDGYWEVWLER